MAKKKLPTKIGSFLRFAKNYTLPLKIARSFS